MNQPLGMVLISIYIYIYLRLLYCQQLTLERCVYVVNPGPCRELIKMYAYDLYENQCKTFFYSGCGGNPNRFKTLSECRVACNALREDEEESIEDILETTIVPNISTTT